MRSAREREKEREGGGGAMKSCFCASSAIQGHCVRKTNYEIEWKKSKRNVREGSQMNKTKGENRDLMRQGKKLILYLMERDTGRRDMEEEGWKRWLSKIEGKEIKKKNKLLSKIDTSAGIIRRIKSKCRRDSNGPLFMACFRLRLKRFFYYSFQTKTLIKE